MRNARHAHGYQPRAGALAGGALSLLIGACGGGAHRPDLQPPTTPEGLSAEAQGSRQVVLSWRAATDLGSGVLDYEVYRDGVGPIARVSGLVYTDSNLAPATAYRYSVRARDAAPTPNVSAESGLAFAFTPGLPDSWTDAAVMSEARFGHSATRLDDGRVLVAGGRNEAQAALATAEIYDPRRNAWSPAGRLATGRQRHAATRLADGRVLVTGGVDRDGTEIASAEIYDPATGSWRGAAPLRAAMAAHAATQLADGRVMVATHYLATRDNVELYDPATDSWAVTDPAPWGPRIDHLEVLGDGRVLLLCAAEFSVPTYAATWSPATGRWSAATEVLLEDGIAIATLGDGRLLVTGMPFVWYGPTPRRSWIYDPGRSLWQAAAGMTHARRGHAAASLPNGKVLVAGGRDVFGASVTDVETFDPATGAWSDVAARGSAPLELRATVLRSGAVLFTGGRLAASGASSQASATAALYWP